jgi:hypothetical protein
MGYLRFELTHFALGFAQFVLKTGDLILVGLNLGRKVAAGPLWWRIGQNKSEYTRLL